jgi:hypothetical protein
LDEADRRGSVAPAVLLCPFQKSTLFEKVAERRGIVTEGNVFERVFGSGRRDGPWAMIDDRVETGSTPGSLRDLLHLMDLITEHGAGFRSLTEAIDTTVPAGRMLMQMLRSFANHENGGYDVLTSERWTTPPAEIR